MFQWILVQRALKAGGLVSQDQEQLMVISATLPLKEAGKCYGRNLKTTSQLACMSKFKPRYDRTDFQLLSLKTAVQ